MANVLNRTTKKFLLSVNTPDFPESDWIHSPDMSAVAGYPDKYWDIKGDIVTLKNKKARAAVDADETATAATAKTAQVEAVAQKAIDASAKLPSPAGKKATLEERVRALELKVYGG